MESDPVLAKRLEDNLNRRNELASPETIVTAPNVSKTDTTKRACHSELESPQEDLRTLEEPRAVRLKLIWTYERYMLENDRWNQMTMQTWYAEWTYVTSWMNHISLRPHRRSDGSNTSERRRGQSTYGRDEVVRKVQCFEEVTDENCVSRTGRKPISCRWKDVKKVTANAWNYEVDWQHATSNRKVLTVTLQEHHHWHSCVM